MEVRAHVTVELAHPSTEPLASRSPTTPAHPRWWFLWTTPGRILTIGVVLSTLVIASAFATSTTINDRQAGADHGSQPHRTAGVRRRTALHDAVGGRRSRGHGIHRRRRTARRQAALRAGDHRRLGRGHPCVERAHRRADGATAGTCQRRTLGVHRAGRDSAYQQPGRKSGRLLVPVRGLGADADARSCPTRSGSTKRHRIGWTPKPRPRHGFPGRSSSWCSRRCCSVSSPTAGWPAGPDDGSTSVSSRAGWRC